MTPDREVELREWAARRSADYTSGALNCLEVFAALDASREDRAKWMEENADLGEENAKWRKAAAEAVQQRDAAREEVTRLWAERSRLIDQLPDDD